MSKTNSELPNVMKGLERTSSAPPENDSNFNSTLAMKKKLLSKYKQGGKEVPVFIPASIQNNATLPSTQHQEFNNSGKNSLTGIEDGEKKPKKSMKLSSNVFKPEDVVKEEELLGDWSKGIKIKKDPPKAPVKVTPPQEPKKAVPVIQNPIPVSLPVVEEKAEIIIEKKALIEKYVKKAEVEEKKIEVAHPQIDKEKEKKEKAIEDTKILAEKKAIHEAEQAKAKADEEEAIAKAEALLREEEARAKAKEEEVKANAVKAIRIKRKLLVDLVLSLRLSPPSESEFSAEIIAIHNRRPMLYRLTKPRKDDRNNNSNYSRGGGGDRNSQHNNNNNKRKPPMKDSRNQDRDRERERGGGEGELNRKPVDPFKEKLKAMGNKWIQANKEKSETDSDLKLFKDIRFALNKLTPDNFDKIRKDVLGFAKQGPAACEKVVLLIIEKSYQERRYSRVYADLCRYLKRDDSINYEEKGEGEAEGEGGKKKKNFFTNHLLNLIQETFYNHMSEENSTDVSKLDEYKKAEFFSKKKNRILGNVHFIGDLLSIKVISRRVIWICAYQMMVRFFIEAYEWIYNSNEGSQRYEENLEGLLTLVEKIGPIIDSVDEKKEYEEDVEKASAAYYAEFLDRLMMKKISKSDLPSEDNDSPVINLNILFMWMDLIKDHSIISTRIKCLMVNIIDVRATGWKKTILQPTGPKTISQLEKEHREQLAGNAEDSFDNDDWGGKSNKRGGGSKKVQSFPSKSDEKNKFEYVKKDAPTHKHVSKSKTLTVDETGKRLANIYSRIKFGRMEDDTEYTKELLLKNCLDLQAECDSRVFVLGALKTIFEQVPVNADKFMEVLLEMIRDKQISAKEAAQALNEDFVNAYYSSTECPNLVKYMAKIIATGFNTGQITFKDLNYEAKELLAREDEDSAEEFEFFLNDYFNALIKFVDEDWKDKVITHAKENCSKFIKE